MRTSETWICLADGDRAQFYHCESPGYVVEPVMGFGLSRADAPFSDRLARQLDRAIRDSLCRTLVLVGPKALLHEVENQMAASTRKRVRQEVDKNLCGCSPRELSTHLHNVLLQ